MEDKKYQEAQKKVREIKGFYIHLTTYVGVNIFLIILNLITSPKVLWFYWVAIFWGIGVLYNAIRIFWLDDKMFGKAWEDKMIEKVMKKDKK